MKIEDYEGISEDEAILIADSLSDFLSKFVGRQMLYDLIVECQLKIDALLLKNFEPSPEKPSSVNSRLDLDSESESDLGHNLQKEFEDLK